MCKSHWESSSHFYSLKHVESNRCAKPPTENIPIYGIWFQNQGPKTWHVWSLFFSETGSWSIQFPLSIWASHSTKRCFVAFGTVWRLQKKRTHQESTVLKLHFYHSPWKPWTDSSTRRIIFQNNLYRFSILAPTMLKHHLPKPMGLFFPCYSSKHMSTLGYRASFFI